MKRALLLCLSIGCTSDVDEQWDLDHDRIIAVRADKPGIVAGERTELVGLIGHVEAPTEERAPALAAVLLPMSLAGSVTTEGGKWFVTAPSNDQMAAARGELMLAADAPIPLQVGVQFGEGLNAFTTVQLGVSAENPVIGNPMIDAAVAPPDKTTEIVVASLVKVPLEVTLAENVDVNWLTAVGQMHDFDLPKAYLRVEKDDPTDGELAVVIRDRKGGIAWQVWTLRATPPPE